MKKFSKLSVDVMTFDHVKLYYDDIVIQKNFTLTDIMIQQRELERHLRSQGLDIHCENEECLKWIEKNHTPFRQYINTLKVFALFMFMENKLEYRKELVWEVFERMVSIFNEYGGMIMDTIKLEK